MNPLFQENINKFKVIDIALWILKCRASQNKENENNNYSVAYLHNVEEFCFEWEKHYQNNEDLYNSSKYRKAMILAGRIEKHKFIIDFGNGTHEITNEIFKDVFKPGFENKFYDIATSCLNDDLKFFSNSFEECFEDSQTYKGKLFKIISEQYFIQPYVRIRVFNDGKWFKASTYNEFLTECEVLENYKIEYEKRELKTSYVQALKTFGITRTVFSEFVSTLACEKEFDKKLFVNLAFALSLPYNFCNKLLTYNGLSLKDSTRQFDIICEKAFRIGYGREYTAALIAKYNHYKILSNPKFAKVPNI